MSQSEFEFEKRKEKLYAKFSKEFIKVIRTDSDARYVVAALLNSADPLVILEKLLLERIHQKEKTRILIEDIIRQSGPIPHYIGSVKIEDGRNGADPSRKRATIELLEFIILQDIPDVNGYPALVPLIREKFDVYKRTENEIQYWVDFTLEMVTDIINWERGNQTGTLEKMLNDGYHIYKK